MEIKRKLQLSAAVVIANGLFVLMSSSPAFAVSCPDQSVCGVPSGNCLSSPSPLCDFLAPPGCTAVSSQCSGPSCPNWFQGGYGPTLTCHYVAS